MAEESTYYSSYTGEEIDGAIGTVKSNSDIWTGKVSSVNIGNTITGQPGTSAKVVNSGTDQDIVLDFTIPRGDTAYTSSSDGFSTNETISGIWINGKPIYRKIFQVQTPKDSNVSIIQNISFLDCDEIVRISGIVKNKADGNFSQYPVNFFRYNQSGTPTWEFISTWVDADRNITMQASIDEFFDCPAVLIFEYTKNKDESKAVVIDIPIPFNLGDSKL